MDILNQAPMACTLSAADFKSRAKWLHELTSEALIHDKVWSEQGFADNTEPFDSHTGKRVA